MASIGQLVRCVADVSGMDEATVKLIARYVRESGSIGQQSTGGGAARMTANDAASLLIAVNTSEAAKDAAEFVKRVGSMIPQSAVGPQIENDEVRYIFSETTKSGALVEGLAKLIELYMPVESGLSVLQYEIDPPISIHIAFERPRLCAIIGVSCTGKPETGLVQFYYEKENKEYADCDRTVESRFTHVTLRKIAAMISN